MQVFIKMSALNNFKQVFIFGFCSRSVHTMLAFSSVEVSQASDVSCCDLATHFDLSLSNVDAFHESTNVDAN